MSQHVEDNHDHHPEHAEPNPQLKALAQALLGVPEFVSSLAAMFVQNASFIAAFDAALKKQRRELELIGKLDVTLDEAPGEHCNLYVTRRPANAAEGPGTSDFYSLNSAGSWLIVEDFTRLPQNVIGAVRRAMQVNALQPGELRYINFVFPETPAAPAAEIPPVDNDGAEQDA